MAYEQRDNTGTLFKNKNKKQENHPDYTGPALVKGVSMRMAGWIKKSQSGETRLSVSFSEDEAKPKPINSAEDDGYTPATPPDSGFGDIQF